MSQGFNNHGLNGTRRYESSILKSQGGIDSQVDPDNRKLMIQDAHGGSESQADPDRL